MSARRPNHTALHLPSLAVKGFRGIADLSIPRLGRVTLIAGKNGVGKTTLLDAVRIYAARASLSVLRNILQNREELRGTIDEDGDEVSVPDVKALFYGRGAASDSRISIGPCEKQRLSIGIVDDGIVDDGELSLIIKFQGEEREIPENFLFRISRSLYRRSLNDDSAHPSKIQCESLGPSLPSNSDMARFWDGVALTDDEIRAVHALRLIYGDDVERVGVIGDESSRLFGRRAIVKINGQERPVPLKSLGDGAVRLFGMALALAHSRDGFLVIDEAENGVHHSVQRDFWKMVMKTALKNNVQVLATTHSWDCVANFAQAATDLEEMEGMLIRLEGKGEHMRAVEYSEEELQIATSQGIEVR